MHADSLQHHISHLEESHSKLNKEVDLYERTGNYTDQDLTVLRKKRLYIKDELARCRQQLTEMLK
jgi:uncharacterized protein YdcH (DUF465 family)